MIKEELGAGAATYLSILAAVAGGETKPSAIGVRAGIETTTASKYLHQLERLHMVEHLRPFGSAPNARRGIWRLSDHYLRAWFSFVRAHRTDLEARRIDSVFRNHVKPALDQFVSKPAFEDAVREHVRWSLGTDPAFPERAEVGAWWGPVPDERHPGTRRTREAEIEVVGYGGQDLVIAVEAKWSASEESGEALAQLRKAVVHVPGYDPEGTRLAIYTREGFTDGFRERAERAGVILRTIEDMF